MYGLRLLEVVHLEAPFDGSSYVCNLNVLRLALQAVRHWLQDLDPDFLEALYMLFASI